MMIRFFMENKGNHESGQLRFDMTQSQWITKSGGKMVEGSKPVVRVSVPRFDKSAIIATYARTLIGRLMNPPKQNMKMMLFQLPRIWQVEGRVVGTDLGLGRFQFAFDQEEDIIEVLKMEPFFFDNWMISLVRWKPVVEANYPSKIIFWVRPMDIPLQYWDAQTFRSIGDVLGRVHGDVDMVEGRVRVELEGFKPLVFTMTVDFDEGVEMPISLRYEKLVGYCKECFCMTHDQSRCPTLTKTVEEGSNMAGYEDRGANVNSYKTAVLNGREQSGERREGQQGRYQNGREGNKGKGVFRDKAGFRFEAAQHKPKDRYQRENGEGSSLHGRQAEETRDESNLMEDGTVFDDSDMLVDTDGLQEWEQGEISDFAEEEAVEGVEEAGDIDEETGEPLVLSNEQGENYGKAPMKKASKGGILATGGNSKKRFVQSIISPRKKLLAKAIARTGQVKKVPAKAKSPTE
ncbi:hypothetical protein Bca4012_062068 [Brassica carinata]